MILEVFRDAYTLFVLICILPLKRKLDSVNRIRNPKTMPDPPNLIRRNLDLLWLKRRSGVKNSTSHALIKHNEIDVLISDSVCHFST